MNRHIYYAIIGLVCVAIVGLLAVDELGLRLVDYTADKPPSNWGDSVAPNAKTEMFVLGETMELTVVADENADEDELASAFGERGFPWLGTLLLTVDAVEYLPSVKDAGAVEFVSDIDPESPIYYIDVTIENKDAVSFTTERKGADWFNITSIFNRNTIPYFNGMPEGADEQRDYYYFRLSPGETAQYRIGIVPDERDEIAALEIGAHGDWKVYISNDG